MRIQSELIEATFLERLNRFAALVEVGGQEQLAHLPNSGRMRELLWPGARLLVAPRPGPRKTRFDLLMVQKDDLLVSVDARIPPDLLAEALAAGDLPGLGPFERLRREVRVGASRLDLVGEGPEGACFIETKSVTLVRNGLALFPDAPTARGTRHLEELRGLAEQGHGAAVVFVVQREDAERLKPHEEADPLFAAALRKAAGTVRVLAYRCRVGGDEVEINRPVPVEL